jgi:hypothetical protein
MEFGRYLVLSTTHIRCSTAENLTRWAGSASGSQPVEVAPTACGWFVSTRLGGDASALPHDLRAVLALGRAHDCHYVLLDSDGDEVSGLQVFPW